MVLSPYTLGHGLLNTVPLFPCGPLFPKDKCLEVEMLVQRVTQTFNKQIVKENIIRHSSVWGQGLETIKSTTNF